MRPPVSALKNPDPALLGLVPPSVSLGLLAGGGGFSNMKHAAPRNAPLGLAGARQRSFATFVLLPILISNPGTRLALGICPGWASWRTPSASTIWRSAVPVHGLDVRMALRSSLDSHESAPTCRSRSPCPASCRESAARHGSLHPSAPSSHLKSRADVGCVCSLLSRSISPARCLT